MKKTQITARVALTPATPGDDPLQSSESVLAAGVDSNDAPNGKDFAGVKRGKFLVAFFDGFKISFDKLRQREDLGAKRLCESGAGGPHGIEVGNGAHAPSKPFEVKRLNVLSIRIPELPIDADFRHLPAALFEEATFAHVVLLNGRLIKSRNAPIQWPPKATAGEEKEAL